MSGQQLNKYLELIRAEYRESPGLRLKRMQIERLWCLDSPTCDTVLGVLLDAGFLRRTRDGDYVRADRGDEIPINEPTSRRPRPVPRAE